MPKGTHFLTDQEVGLMDRISDLSRGLFAMVGPDAENDAREVGFLIHCLQNMVMSQAAARAYPIYYRTYGEVPEWRKQEDRAPTTIAGDSGHTTTPSTP